MLTISQRRSQARRAARECERSIDAAVRECAAIRRAEEEERRANAKPAPVPVPVDLTTCRPGDRVELATGRMVEVAKVNRKSIVSTGGVRWTVAEIVRVVRR